MKVAIYNTIGFLFGEYRKRIIGGPWAKYMYLKNIAGPIWETIYFIDCISKNYCPFLQCKLPYKNWLDFLDT